MNFHACDEPRRACSLSRYERRLGELLSENDDLRARLGDAAEATARAAAEGHAHADRVAAAAAASEAYWRAQLSAETAARRAAEADAARERAEAAGSAAELAAGARRAVPAPRRHRIAPLLRAHA